MYRLVVALVQPYTLFLLLSWLALAILWRKRREPRRRHLLLLLPLLALTLMSTPAMAYLMIGTLQWHYPPGTEVPDDARAIVVLGGSVSPPNASRAQALLASDSMYRCLHALDLYRRKPCLIVVSGGKVDPDQPGPTVAEAMADFLRSRGVEARDLVVEGSSRSTYENAVESARLLEQRQIHKIVLVTEVRHMLRSEGCFRKQGLEVIPSACGYGTLQSRFNFYAFVPNPNAARDCQMVFHEWLGIAWYRLHGRI